MFSSDKNIETIGQLVELVKHRIGLQGEYLKLEITEKTVRLITAILLFTHRNTHICIVCHRICNGTVYGLPCRIRNNGIVLHINLCIADNFQKKPNRETARKIHNQSVNRISTWTTPQNHRHTTA